MTIPILIVGDRRMCKVLLNTIEKVKKFVGITTNFETDVFLISGRYVIDAKSIMGIFSLDLSKPIEMKFECENNCDDNLVAGYMEQIAEFVL